MKRWRWCENTEAENAENENGGSERRQLLVPVRDRFTVKIMAADAGATLCVTLNERGRPMKLHCVSIKAKESVPVM